MNLQDADKALGLYRAMDWTVACSYLALKPNVEWRHYDLPNGMMVSLWSEASEADAALVHFGQRGGASFRLFTVIDITVANSRMLRADKAETSYSVASLEQQEGLRTRLSGIKPMQGSGAFVYKGMPGRDALATIAGAGKKPAPLEASEVKRMRAVLDQLQRWPQPPGPDKFDGDGRWHKFLLSSDLELFVQLKSPADSRQDLVALIFCRYTPAGEKETLIEYELLDVLDPILDGRKRRG